MASEGERRSVTPTEPCVLLYISAGVSACQCACMSVLLFCDPTLGAATYPSVIMAMLVRRHTKVLAVGEG